MNAPVNIVLHDIEQPGQFPDNVFDIYQSLSYPLPRVLLSDNVRHRLSPGASELFEHALQSPLFALEDQETTEHSRILVSDVIDTILSCASMVKAASSF